jgi:ABC-type Zn uptake system ZnuABC Zn-binding protein ZnuA
VQATTLRAIMRAALLLVLLSGGCAPATARPSQASGQGIAPATLPTVQPARLDAGQKLRVVATTSVLGDVVRNVGGDAIDLTMLMAPGQDPHAYEPTPRDIAAIEKSQVVFENGLGLEAGLHTTISAAAAQGQPIIPISIGTKVLSGSGPVTPAPADSEQAGNPHVWLDPTNVSIWVHNLDAILSTLDPLNAGTYHKNATAYEKQLQTLDATIQAQVAQVPQDHRKLVTDHEALEYFAARYSFEVVGTLIPGYSTIAEPSASNLAGLIQTIRGEKVPAVFIGTTANPRVADVVARETGAKVIALYSESLGGPGSGADTYLSMMQFDVDAIVKGLS